MCISNSAKFDKVWPLKAQRPGGLRAVCDSREVIQSLPHVSRLQSRYNCTELNLLLEMLSDILIINVNSLAWSKVSHRCECLSDQIRQTVLMPLAYMFTLILCCVMCLTWCLGLQGDCISSWFVFYQSVLLQPFSGQPSPTPCHTSKKLSALSPYPKYQSRMTLPVDLVPAASCLALLVTLPAGSVSWLPFLLPNSMQ